MLPLIFLINLLVSGWVLAADIQVSSDRNPVPLDESFTLTYSASTEPDGEPDFSPLDKDFEILNQGQNSQVSIINGHFQRDMTWAVSLLPKRAGSLLIPPIPFGNDHSASLALTVVPAASADGKSENADIFLEVEVNPRQPYVQAQSIYTVRVLNRVMFNGGELSEPAAEHVLIQRLGEDRRYSTERQGQRYQVIERQYALFPQQSGPLTIPGLMLSTQIPGGSGFNPFMGRQMQLKRQHSEPLTLTVKPVPDSWKGHPWLPAEQLDIEENWSKAPESLSVGEPVTRTLTLKAQGATVGLLPDLMETDDPANNALKRYPDQPLLNEEKLASGLLSVRQEKAAYIPSRPGQYTVPAVAIYWWNIHTQRQEVAQLPARIITVKGTLTNPAPASPPPQTVQTPTTPQAPVAEMVPNNTNPPGEVAPPPRHWIVLTALFATIWILTLLAWWRERRGRSQIQPSSTASTNQTSNSSETRAILAALQTACQENNAAEAHKGLLAWMRQQKSSNTTSNLETLATLADTPLVQALEQLNQQLYGNAPRKTWDGMGLWTAFATCLLQQSQPAVSHKPTPTLEPLYRQNSGE